MNCTLALLTASGIHYEMKVLRWSGGGGGLPIKSLFNKTGRGLNEAVRAAGRASLGEAVQLFSLVCTWLWKTHSTDTTELVNIMCTI